jgi:GT2 family glycosyltransferase
MQFSIVIPTFQRKDDLRACLRGIAQLDFPREEFEVIVVDDGSPEAPTDVVNAYKGDLAIQIVVVSQNGGPARARNLGARHAIGEYLVLLDDDCIPEREWLTSLAARRREFPEALIGGVLVNGAPHSLCAEASQQLGDFLYRYYNADIDNAGWFMSANLACPRAAFLAMGGFDASFPLAAAEDRDFCDRWREAGMRLVMAPHAMVHHMRSMTFRPFWKQHRTYGRGARHLHIARAKRQVAIPRCEPLVFYIRLLCAPVAHSRGMRTPLLVFLMLVSQVAYASGFYAERRGPPTRRLPEERGLNA